jgi:hypothetical protein
MSRRIRRNSGVHRAAQTGSSDIRSANGGAKESGPEQTGAGIQGHDPSGPACDGGYQRRPNYSAKGRWIQWIHRWGGWLGGNAIIAIATIVTAFVTGVAATVLRFAA